MDNLIVTENFLFTGTTLYMIMSAMNEEETQITPYCSYMIVVDNMIVQYGNISGVVGHYPNNNSLLCRHGYTYVTLWTGPNRDQIFLAEQLGLSHSAEITETLKQWLTTVKKIV